MGTAITAHPVMLVALIAVIISVTWAPGGHERGAGAGVRIALASQSTSQQAQNATATPATPATPTTNTDVAPAVDITPTLSNNNAPTPVNTSGAGAVSTAAPQPVSTGVVPGSSQGDTTSRTSGGDFPWLIMLLVALIVLAGLGYAAMRQRQPAEVAGGPEAANLRRRSDIANAMQPQADAVTTTRSDVIAETTSAPATGEPAAPAAPVAAGEEAAAVGAAPAPAPAPTVTGVTGAAQEPSPVSGVATPATSAAPPAPSAPLAPPAPVTSAASASVTTPFAVPGVAPAAMPATVECANCGATNSTSEKFCHECGQDLRPQLAQLAAAVAASLRSEAAQPIDVVEADTPYLETLDRVDEQLEFVLSRPRVVIGTAGGNDIVVDSAFKHWRTVSPVHAELRREQDGFAIMDRDSEYGTFVNEMRTGESILSDGDLVRLGDVRFIFRVPKVGT